MNATNVSTTTSTVMAEPFEIDLMDEFDCDESNGRPNSLVVAEEFNDLITEFDNAGIVEDISVLTSVPATATAVYVPSSIPPTIQVAETSPSLDIYRNHSLDDGDEMLVEAIEIISCENTFLDNTYTYNDAAHEGSQFVEYSTDPFEAKSAISDVNMLHNKMDAFISDNNMFDSNECLEDDDIEVFATMMQTIEEEYVNQTSERVENKHIMQAMVVSNQQHVEEVNAYQQQQEDIAVQIGPICTAPFSSDTPQFSMGSTTDSTSSHSGSSKKKCAKKKKEKKGGFGKENADEYEGQKNILRQEATAKRKRTAGKFAKRKIEWMTITEAMKNNQANADESKS